MLHTLDGEKCVLMREGILFLGQWAVLAGVLFLVLQGMGVEHALQTMEAGDVQAFLRAVGTPATSESPIHFWVEDKLIEISALCSGLLEMILLACVILVTPNESWRKKILGVVGGIILLYAFNIARMVITIQQLVHTPYSFAEFTHDVLFRLILIAGFAFLYWAWLHWDRIHVVLVHKGLI